MATTDIHLDRCQHGAFTGAIEALYPRVVWESVASAGQAWSTPPETLLRTARLQGATVVAYGGDGMWYALRPRVDAGSKSVLKQQKESVKMYTRFQESAAEHAQRIGLSEHHTGILRQVLALKRDEQTAAHETWAAAASTLATLETELGVVWQDDTYLPDDFNAPTIQDSADVERQQTHGSKKLLLAQYGLYKGKQPPYGYLFDCEVRIKTADGRVVTGHSLIPDPDTETIVEHIFAEFANGTALAAIVASLNICDVVSPAGASWDERQVGAIVRRAPLYAGFIGYRDGKHKQTHEPEILYPGRHAALIDLETTLAVLAVTGRTLEWEFASTRESAVETEEWD